MADQDEGEGPETPGKPRIGRPPHEPTDELRREIRTLAKVAGLEVIAETVKLSISTLDKYYRAEIEDGRREAISAVKGKLLHLALAGSVNAAWKYLLVMGEVKPSKVELTGPNGGPIETVDLTRLNDKELDEYGRIAAIANGLDPDALLIEPLGD